MPPALLVAAPIAHHPLQRLRCGQLARCLKLVSSPELLSGDTGLQELCLYCRCALQQKSRRLASDNSRFRPRQQEQIPENENLLAPTRESNPPAPIAKQTPSDATATNSTCPLHPQQRNHNSYRDRLGCTAMSFRCLRTNPTTRSAPFPLTCGMVWPRRGDMPGTTFATRLLRRLVLSGAALVFGCSGLAIQHASPAHRLRLTPREAQNTEILVNRNRLWPSRCSSGGTTGCGRARVHVLARFLGGRMESACRTVRTCSELLCNLRK